MCSFIELSAFSLKNDINDFPSILMSIINHTDEDNDSFIRLYYVKRDGCLKCYVGIEECYKNIVINLLLSYGYIAKELQNNDFLINLQSNIYISRKVRKDNAKQGIEFSDISEQIKAPTLSYILSSSRDGSGIMFYIGRIGGDQIKHTFEYVKKGLTNYQIIGSYNTKNVIETQSAYIASAFTFGDIDSQRNLASELSFVIQGWKYICLDNNEVALDEDSIKNFLNTFAPVCIYRNQIMSPLLYHVTKEEFEVITSIFDLLIDNPDFPRNLDTLWKSSVSKYFKIRDDRVNIDIGSALYSDDKYYFTLDKLRQGLLIVGAPGSGKGNQLFRIINQLNQDPDLNILIFESAKQEMHHLRKIITDLKIWRPVSGQFVFNPFEIPKGLTLAEYRTSLIQILKTCFKTDGPLEELYTSTLNGCFYNANYKESSRQTDSDTLKWGLNEFIVEYKKFLNRSGYSDRVKDDMRQAGVTRLRALIDSSPDVFDTNHSVDITGLVKGKHLIQLNSLASIESKQSLATMILIAVGTYMKLKFEHCDDPDKLNLVIVLDESHNLLKSVNDVNGNSYAFADDFSNLILTLRSVGVGFIISDQMTSNIPKVISDVCDTKIFMGSSKYSGINDYLDFLGADDQLLSNLYRLKKGEGIVSDSTTPHGLFFRTDNFIDSFNLSEDYPIVNDFIAKNENDKAATFNECKFCRKYFSADNCSIKLKQSARIDANKLINMFGNPFLWKYFTSGTPIKEKHNIIVKVAAKVLIDAESPCCSFIQYLRLCNIVYDTEITLNDMDSMVKYFSKCINFLNQPKKIN